MSYADQSALSSDPEFNRRTTAALTTEGRAKPADPLGAMIMRSPQQGVSAFMPWLSSAPGFADKYGSGGQQAISDGDILAAVQANWADVAAVQGLS